jgi:hypothetical protein
VQRFALRASSLREAPAAPNPPPLSAVAVPTPFPNDVVDSDAAIRLGKALFLGHTARAATARWHAPAVTSMRARTTGAATPSSPAPMASFQAVAGPGALWDGVSIGPNSDDRVGSQGRGRRQIQGHRSGSERGRR